MSEPVNYTRWDSVEAFLVAHVLRWKQLRPNMEVILFQGDLGRPSTVSIAARGIFKGLVGEGDDRAIVLGLPPEQPGYTPEGRSLLGGISTARDTASGLYVPDHIAEEREHGMRRIIPLRNIHIADGDAYMRWTLYRSSRH